MKFYVFQLKTVSMYRYIRPIEPLFYVHNLENTGNQGNITLGK